MLQLYYIIYLTGLASTYFSDKMYYYLINGSYTAIVYTIYGVLLTAYLSDNKEYNHNIIPIILGYGGTVYQKNPNMTKNLYIDEGFYAIVFSAVAMYFTIGYLWSMIKFFGYINSSENRELIKNINAEQDKQTFVNNQKTVIFGWILYWPFNIIHSLLVFFTSLILDMVFYLLKSTYIDFLSLKIKLLNKIRSISRSTSTDISNASSNNQYQENYYNHDGESWFYYY